MSFASEQLDLYIQRIERDIQRASSAQERTELKKALKRATDSAALHKQEVERQRLERDASIERLEQNALFTEAGRRAAKEQLEQEWQGGA